MLEMIKQMLGMAPSYLTGKPKNNERSPQWKTVRKHFLEGKTCAACGTTDNLEAHHKKPFHVHPELELDPSNLIALCEKPGHCCHFRMHDYNWQHWREDVDVEAERELADLSKFKSL